MKVLLFVSLLLAWALSATPSGAAEARIGDIVVTQAWGRASVGTGPAALYLTLRNEGSEPDRLVGIETPAAAQAELHVMTMDGDVARMRPAESVELPPGETVTLAPGGTHIMLTGLPAPLKAGDLVPVRLRFDRSGRLDISCKIGPIGAQGP